MVELRSAHPRAWLSGSSCGAWSISLVLHAAGLAALGIAITPAPQGAAPQPMREVSITLVARLGGSADSYSEEIREPMRLAVNLAPPLFQPPPVQRFAPQSVPTTPPATAAIQNVSYAEPIPSALPVAPPAPIPSKAAFPGRGREQAVETQVFGVRGRGTKFVYVFDRSSSMEGAPLVAAKRELIASLQSLQSVHQFQILFYNQEPQQMPPLRGQRTGMVNADEPAKQLAARFIGSIMANGPTEHMRALEAALRMRPDVIFFLTDANEPQLTDIDFRRLAQWNQGTLINAIEFGSGPPRGQFNFLVRLAAETGGQHTYVDVMRLRGSAVQR